jgi:peptidoglycan hydrolase-like protein with peptidoglycan-binding domain
VKTATLELEDESFELLIGDLDPVEALRGAQARLHNLGFDCGAADNLMGPLTKDALELFQETYELEISGELDEPTQEKLSELHDNLPQTKTGADDSETAPRTRAEKVYSVHHVARSTKGFERVNVIDTASVLMFSV